MKPLEQAIAICGGQTQLGRRIGCRQSRISNWLIRGSKTPAEMCIRIERATDGRVTREMLRPDVFLEDVAVAQKASKGSLRRNRDEQRPHL